MTFTNWKQWLEGADTVLEGYELIIRLKEAGDKMQLVVTLKTLGQAPELQPQVYTGTTDEIAAILEGTAQELPENLAEIGDRYAQWREAFDAKDSATPAATDAPKAERKPRTRKEVATSITADPNAVVDAAFNVLLTAVKQGVRTVDDVKRENTNLSTKQLQELDLSAPAEVAAPIVNPVTDLSDMGDLSSFELPGEKTDEQVCLELLADCYKHMNARNWVAMKEVWAKTTLYKDKVGEQVLQKMKAFITEAKSVSNQAKPA